MTIAKGRFAWAAGPRGLLLLPVIGAAIGGAAILISDRGVADRPALSALILAVATAAGLAPLRYGLPVAVVIAFFEGFMADFAGDPALYWNEVFIALLAARSLRQRRPSWREGLVVAAFAALFLGYLAAGTKPLAVFWGAKVLLTSVIAAWAIARMRGLGRREWLAINYGLATGVAASLVLAGWQRHVGFVHLLRQGLPDGRIRDAEGGGILAHAGFASASPFAYTLALALLCWLGLALSSRERVTALWTVWLPLAGIVGLAWTNNHLTPLALGIALVALAARSMVGRRWKALLLATLMIGVGGAAVGVAYHRWSSRASATIRMRLWEEYLRELSPFGAGPASAGSAYRHAEFRPWLPPLTFGTEWPEYSVDHGQVLRGMRTAGTLYVTAGDARTRPPLTLRTGVASPLRSRQLVIRFHGSVLFRGSVPADRYRPIQLRVPAGQGSARLDLKAMPRARRISPGRPAIAIRVRGPLVVGVPRARTPTLRVYQRMWERDAGLRLNPRGLLPGTVDNQYVSWVFQYGIFGGVLCVVWLGVLLVPLVRRGELRSLALGGGFCAAFLAAAGLGVNIWEESPADLLGAVVLGLAFAAIRSRNPNAARSATN